MVKRQGLEWATARQLTEDVPLLEHHSWRVHMDHTLTTA